MKNNTRILLLLGLFLMSVTSGWAQGVVTGTVLDDTAQPLPGVAVLVAGTTTGTVTDFDGKYTLNAPSDAQLQFSFIGFETQTVPVNGQSVVNCTMKSDSKELDELVVVGYGTMKKSDLSGASVTMGESALKGSLITNLDQSLQGRAAGVTSVSTSGAPGSSTSIRVRGTATINANAEPLYVIDGVIVQGGGSSGADWGLGDALGNGKTSTISPLSTINPSDIVSMEILKDASATAIYGAQGANGVVLITTKRGKEGDATFTYEGLFAWNKQIKKLDIMDLREFATYIKEGFCDAGELQIDKYDDYMHPELLGKGTNWQDAIFQTAFQHQHTISCQGGTEKVKYFVSGSLMNQDGTIIGSRFKRLSIRANMDAMLKPWFKLGYSVLWSRTKERFTLADQEQGVIRYSLTTPPDIPIYNVDGSYSSVAKEGFTNPNPIAMAMLDERTLERQKINGNIFAEISPDGPLKKRLTWHTEYGWDLGFSNANRYERKIDLGTWKRDNNSSSRQKNENRYWQAKNYLTWADQVGRHRYSVMVGHEAWESKWNHMQVGDTNLPSDEVQNPSLGTSGAPKINYGWGSSSMVSIYARATYSFDNRYNLTYTFRRDGSSNFGPDKRWANFNAAAVSWRITEEHFVKDAGIENILSNAKLRIGWGQTGNANIGGYKWGSALSKMESAFGSSSRPANIPNTEIQWETQTQWNFGLDLGFIRDRLNVTFDIYKKKSEDMLMQLNLPSYLGTKGNVSSAVAAPWGNYGTIENKGIELTVSGQPFQRENFQWTSEFQISWNKNKLKSLGDQDAPAIVGYGQWSDVVTHTQVGDPLFNFYGFVTDGVYKDKADIENSPRDTKYPDNGTFSRVSTVWPGDMKYKDINGDGIIDENDKTNLGSPFPKFTFGWTNTFQIFMIDLSVFLNGSYGNKVYNYLAQSMTHMNSAWVNQYKDVNDCAHLAPVDPNYTDGTDAYKWYDDVNNVKVTNPDTDVPRASINDPNDNDRVSDRYIEDGSYLRLKNITVGYNFPSKMMEKIHFKNIRVYVNLQNVATATKYSGYDPEIGASTASDNVYGLDNGRYPSPSTYSFGVNLTF